MKSFLFIGWAILAMNLLACNSNKRTEDRSAEDVTAKEAAFSCYPDTLYRNDTLLVKMALPHPEELAILAPDKVWFFIQPPKSLAPPLISHEDFKNMPQLEIIPTQTHAAHWIDGNAESNLVFIKTGWYRIFLGDNLETEFENALVYQDSVYYLDQIKGR